MGNDIQSPVVFFMHSCFVHLTKLNHSGMDNTIDDLNRFTSNCAGAYHIHFSMNSV